MGGGSVAGVGIGLIAGGARVKAKSRALRAQAAADRENARILEVQAKFREVAGEREAEIFESEADEQIGAQISGFAAAGIQIEGSSLDLISESEHRKSEELSAIRNQTAFDASITRLNAAQFEKSAAGVGATISEIKRAEGIRATGSILSAGLGAGSSGGGGGDGTSAPARGQTSFRQTGAGSTSGGTQRRSFRRRRR